MLTSHFSIPCTSLFSYIDALPILSVQPKLTWETQPPTIQLFSTFLFTYLSFLPFPPSFSSTTLTSSPHVTLSCTYRPQLYSFILDFFAIFHHTNIDIFAFLFWYFLLSLNTLACNHPVLTMNNNVQESKFGWTNSSDSDQSAEDYDGDLDMDASSKDELDLHALLARYGPVLRANHANVAI